MTSAEAQRLERVAAERADGGEEVVTQAAELRTLLERILHALLVRQRPVPDDIAALNSNLAVCRYLPPVLQKLSINK